MVLEIPLWLLGAIVSFLGMTVCVYLTIAGVKERSYGLFFGGFFMFLVIFLVFWHGICTEIFSCPELVRFV